MSGFDISVNLNEICPPQLVVESQPFYSNMLDPVSQQLYNTLQTSHMSSQGLLAATGTGGTQLNATICGQFQHIKVS